MPKYLVNPGVRFGVAGKYGPGTVVELDEEAAGPFLDKLTPYDEMSILLDEDGAADPVDLDVDGWVASHNIADVLNAIDENLFTANEAYAAEVNGKGRVKLIKALTESPNDD